MNRYERLLLTIYELGYRTGARGLSCHHSYINRDRVAMFTKGWQAGRIMEAAK